MMHCTPNGKPKVKCLMDADGAQYTMGSSKKLEFHCDVCEHSFYASLGNITNGMWCGMCSTKWKHCGKKDCTFCYERSFASYQGVTPNGKRKVDCLVEPMDARLPISSSAKKVQFNCDVCKHTFSTMLSDIRKGWWCGMCSRSWKHCGKTDCTFCYERSFASYEGITPNGKRKVDCLVEPMDARLPISSSTKKVQFNCDVCKHSFSATLGNISRGQWCGMCSGSRWKHCGKTDCTFCYERSFASYEDVTLNGKRKVDCLVNPQHARLTISSNKKVQFNCDVCKHSFSARLGSITRGGWCGMCSSKWKHCGKTDCTFCYERSFASYEGITPNGKRKVHCLVNANDARYGLGSKKKLEFNCDVCDNTFSTRLNCVSRSGRWCPHCKNKTEAKVLRFLRNELNLEVATQYTIRHEVRTYKKRFRFDFYMPAHGIILEVDGPQHTQEVSNKWIRSTLLHRQILDAWKERLARRNDLRVVRLDQPSIWRDSYDWRTEIKVLLDVT